MVVHGGSFQLYLNTFSKKKVIPAYQSPGQREVVFFCGGISALLSLLLPLFLESRTVVEEEVRPIENVEVGHGRGKGRHDRERRYEHLEGAGPARGPLQWYRVFCLPFGSGFISFTSSCFAVVDQGKVFFICFFLFQKGGRLGGWPRIGWLAHDIRHFRL